MVFPDAITYCGVSMGSVKHVVVMEMRRFGCMFVAFLRKCMCFFERTCNCKKARVVSQQSGVVASVNSFRMRDVKYETRAGY